MVDQTPPRAFIGLPVCRLLDTRPPANNPLDGDGAYAVDETRTYTLPGNCGLPTGTDAVSLNMSVTNTGAQPFGHLKVWPADQAEPNVSTLNYPGGGATLANAAIVALSISPAGQIKVKSGLATADVIMDVNGYFSDVLGTPANFFELTSSAPGQGTIRGTNTSTTSDSAGLRGIDGTGAPSGATGFAPAGIRGESTSAYGVLGLSRFVGVRGDVLDTSGASLAEGRLGYSVSGTNYGVYAIGDIGATGTKSFVLPHPTDPSLVIRYISLEGPEAGTYFRGRGRLEGRSTVIDVPESFRLVTEADGLSIQLTPIGGHATLWVTELNLDQIAVQGSRDVEFFFTVNGIRRDYGGFQAIAQSSEFVPESATTRLPDALPAQARRNLVTNGTYNEDGSVNLETAQRLDWIRIWTNSMPRNHEHE